MTATRHRTKGHLIDPVLLAEVVRKKRISQAEADQLRTDVGRLNYLERAIAGMVSEARVIEARVLATSARISAKPTFGGE